MGGESTPSRAEVQSTAAGYSLPARALKRAFDRAPILHPLLRYTEALITQMARRAAWARHRSLDQPLCRWLLMSQDRLRGDELFLTQELIDNMLGVRLESVAQVTLNLRRAGLIRYARGLTSRYWIGQRC